MNLERVFRILEGLGLTRVDVEVYVYLGKTGPRKGKDLAVALRLTRQQLYPALKNLQSKGMVTVNLDHPALFSALSFEKVLDLFIKAKVEEAKAIKETKEELLSSWKNMSKGDNT